MPMLPSYLVRYYDKGVFTIQLYWRKSKTLLPLMLQVYELDICLTLPVRFSTPHPCNSPLMALLNDLMTI